MSNVNFTEQNTILILNGLAINESPDDVAKYSLVSVREKYSLIAGISKGVALIGSSMNPCKMIVNLMMGGEQAHEFIKWYEGGQIIQGAGQVVSTLESFTFVNGIISGYAEVRRGGRDKGTITNWQFTINFVDHKLQP